MIKYTLVSDPKLFEYTDGDKGVIQLYLTETLKGMKIDIAEIQKYTKDEFKQLFIEIWKRFNLNDLSAIIKFFLNIDRNIFEDIFDKFGYIPSHVFRYDEFFKTIEIVDNIKSIDFEAFSGSKSLEKIIIHNCEDIHSLAFENCDNLSYFELDNKVKWFGKEVWSFSEKLSEINYKGTTEEWNNITKENNSMNWACITTIHCIDGDIRR